MKQKNELLYLAVKVEAARQGKTIDSLASDPPAGRSKITYAALWARLNRNPVTQGTVEWLCHALGLSRGELAARVRSEYLIKLKDGEAVPLPMVQAVMPLIGEEPTTEGAGNG